ncbi:MAG: hypothetical protein E5X53_32705 [Mesorhizobium sp.]|uniref:hypothetical protein n=1 Tax=Mesorhizobium sp. TaxID=1871066 RepID=UPI00121AE63A|nr:hypothetical protein [Mesorhizobium sp.]TIP69431.1 MAG: hypothetical protein E5X55_32300 [Mesorhizobium sp.]TIQ03499.1 MAG: hypothetical protein E5X57_30750 [Mesorhizobium sp.]TIR47730.1 MAG: hypothetical protein E5X53_32705 [Mesorhizobium sp.]TJV94564.1 MAG: hypothetical protein E5X52_28530 [Mesorhizobium sp.]
MISQKKHLIGALAATVMGSSAMSVGAAEWSPTYLGCVFTESAFSATDDIYPDHRNEERLKVGSTKFEMAFAAIDLSVQRAQLIGNQGSAQITARRGGFQSVVFMEWTPLGSVNLTTVLPPTKDGTIRAIASRHIVEPLSGYMASQFLGTCKDRIGELPG